MNLLSFRSIFDQKKHIFSWPYGTIKDDHMSRPCMSAPEGWQFISQTNYRYEPGTKFYARRVPMRIARLR